MDVHSVVIVLSVVPVPSQDGEAMGGGAAIVSYGFGELFAHVPICVGLFAGGHINPPNMEGA